MIGSELKVAIAGFGTMGKKYAETIRRIPGTRVTAICTSRPESAISSGAHEKAALFQSYEDMLSYGDFDVVCITVPTYLHKSYTVQAAANRKHVICEKPIALKPEDAFDMISTCEKYGVRLFVGHVLRFFPEYRNLRELVLNGSVGSVGISHAKRASACPEEGSWFTDRTKSGGVIMDLMIHDIDFMRWTIGEAESAFAFSRTADGVEYASVTLRFTNGAIANLEAHWGYPGPFTTRIEITGEYGILRNDNLSSRSLVLRKASTTQQGSRGVIVPEVTAGYDPFWEEIYHFLNCIRHNDTPIVTAEDAAQALEIASAAIKSAQTGTAVRIPKSRCLERK
ncbi:Gfo/Idh/MocA family protein [Cohnella silvisoli]|uniref:Gfo/Idh/MocA family oxidoreductase n=1 Tax=Cohnella silvisoli TaxID=2873699 RepID=A0ABV1KS68_9BACL|nr:Gfo/Idh/MocA family oxidoreductase [Cohnella silvisoli]MCD9022433.1 Gfo/Idh/MocA family oxidoreductase [Cohnella silvisoli]